MCASNWHTAQADNITYLRQALGSDLSVTCAAAAGAATAHRS